MSEATTPERPWFRRHRVAVVIAMVFAVVLASFGGWLVYLNEQISNVPRVALDLEEAGRPPRVTGKAAEAVNILLAGADAGQGPSIAQAVADGKWEPYSHRSDTIIVLHITADRDQAYLVSVPRDSWTRIPGLGMNKINAAFAAGGPSLYVQTLEKFSGLRMDHLAIIDWEGFRELTTAIGGVPITIPEDIYDPSQRVQWEAGKQELEGLPALQYVRMRYGLENGDFDRIERQQNFLRAFMKKMLSNGTTSNPIKLTNSVEAIVKYLTVDDEFSNGQMRSLAFSMRSMEEEDVTFITVPRRRYATIDGQSVVLVDRQQTRDLFRAVGNDELGSYVDQYGRAEVLGKAKDVS
jgi:LCP family protein required for cell wall assembly